MYTIKTSSIIQARCIKTYKHMEVTENNTEGRPLVILQELPFISLFPPHTHFDPLTSHRNPRRPLSARS